MATPELPDSAPLLIADSSALFALENSTDETNRLAISVINSLPDGTVILLPAEIFAEVMNTLWKKAGRQVAIRAAAGYLSSPMIRITESSNAIRNQALEIFRNLRSKNISFTDCLVMAYATVYKTKLIFGFDEGFKKNGFRRLGID